MSFLDRLSEPSYAIFRMVVGFLFIFHGTQKLFDFPVAFPFTLNSMNTAAAVIELVAGTMVAVGFYSRYAAFLASGTMAVAYWMVHGPRGLFPIANGGVIAALYCFAFLHIATQGPGIWSLNKK